MSLDTGPPAPPPLRKSRWSWWKPVKGTSAADDYYYNINSTDGGSNSRPGSRKGRSSLSVLDDRRAEVLRKEALESLTSVAPAAVTAHKNTTRLTNNVVGTPATSDDLLCNNPGEGGGGVRSKNNRKSTSR
jgi:hypothetical protein